MEQVAKLKNIMRTENGKKLEEAEKRLKYGVEAKLHYHCKDKRHCVQFIHNHPLDGQKRWKEKGKEDEKEEGEKEKGEKEKEEKEKGEKEKDKEKQKGPTGTTAEQTKEQTKKKV